jgi:GntR family transcriptional regulator
MSYSLRVSDISISITLDSPVPVYRQVVDQIRVPLASGALAAGDALPSVRGLAGQLGVHFNTVADAYRELAAEGWIDLAHGKRAVVAEMRLKGVPARLIQQDVEEILSNNSLSNSRRNGDE